MAEQLRSFIDIQKINQYTATLLKTLTKAPINRFEVLIFQINKKLTSQMQGGFSTHVFFQGYGVAKEEEVEKSSGTDSTQCQISSKTSRVKNDSTKDAIKDITSDSQVNSYFPYRWSLASLKVNIYFYLFSFFFISKLVGWLFWA